jgi:hypothetical protein
VSVHENVRQLTELLRSGEVDGVVMPSAELQDLQLRYALLAAHAVPELLVELQNLRLTVEQMEDELWDLHESVKQK